MRGSTKLVRFLFLLALVVVATKYTMRRQFLTTDSVPSAFVGYAQKSQTEVIEKLKNANDDVHVVFSTSCNLFQVGTAADTNRWMLVRLLLCSFSSIGKVKYFCKRCYRWDKGAPLLESFLAVMMILALMKARERYIRMQVVSRIK